MKIAQAPSGIPNSLAQPAPSPTLLSLDAMTLRAPVVAFPKPVESGGEGDLALGIFAVFNDKLASQLSFQQALTGFQSIPPMASPGLLGAAPYPAMNISGKAGLDFASSAMSAYGAPDSGLETLGAAGAAIVGWWNYFERWQKGDMTPAEHVAAALSPGLATFGVAMTCFGFNVTAHWLSTGANVCNVVNVGFQMAHKPK